VADSVIGRGIIELVADGRKLKAGIDDAKKAVRTLAEGQKDITRAQSASIDRYIGNLKAQNDAIGKTARQTELLKLAMRGASNEQINAADAALKVTESHQRMEVVAGRLKAGLIGLGIAAAGAIAVKTSGTIDFLDKLNDLNKSTGIAVEDLAGLSLLAKQTGTDLDGLAKGINKMTVELGKEPEKFRELGVTARDGVGAFKELADIFNTIPDIALRNALAQKVFSKSWQELAPALSEGSQGIAEAIAKGSRLSGITKEMAREADAFKDKLAELEIASSAFGANFIPILNKLLGLLISAKEKTDSWGKSFATFFGAGDDKQRIAGLSEEIAKANAELDRAQKAGPGLRPGERQVQAMQARVDALTKERDALIPELQSHQTVDQAGAADAARIKAAADATARASAFVKEPKTGGASGPDPLEAARQQAREQLQSDLADIKRASDAQINTFQNAERIMQAMRSAALVDDKDYFAAKLGFIQLNAQQQELALQQEIDRLQRETFAGKNADKDRLENARKIAEAQGKINKVREDAAASAVVNATEEGAALKRIAQGYAEAEAAAKNYLETVARRNAREVEGIGRGSRFREINAGRGEIDDKLLGERRRLEGERRRGQITSEQFDTYLQVAQKTYAKEVALYEQRTSAILQSESEWINGANEALQNYIDESKNIAKQTEDLFSNAFKSAEDAMVEFLDKGEFTFKSFKDMVNKIGTSIVSDLNRMFVKEFITGPLAEFTKGNLGDIGKLIGLGSPGAATKGAGLVDTGEAIPGVPAWLNALLGRTKAGVGGAGIGTAANDAAFGTAVTAAATGFSTTTTAAGATLSAEVTAGGATFSAETVAAGASFAAEVAAAGAAFAASVAAGSAASGAADIGGGLFDEVLDSFASGTSYVPKTGPYMLHQGERVTPAGEDDGGDWGGGRQVIVNMPITFQGPQDRASVAQGLTRGGQQVQRSLSRFG
jgi:lambda family phage tail tape measure protein